MSSEPSRALALDLGDKRIGVAVSDPLGVTAQPLGYRRRLGRREGAEDVRRLVQDLGVDRVVVGHPLLLSGLRGARAEDAERFAEALRAVLPAGVAVMLWDERLTTAQAERALVADGVRRRRRREIVDALAAALILQSWLDARRGEAGGEGSPGDQPST